MNQQENHSTPSTTLSPDIVDVGRRPSLELRFVVRISRNLGHAIGAAARRDGVTAGAWVRRVLLERLDLHSNLDARSGRPVFLPAEEVAELAAAVRELASVNNAIATADTAAAKAGLDRTRHHLIPVLMRQSRR
ncbi:hypothetical protein [Methylobacterium pseudosasicola]|uniref:hypothetical protein n=1 Tax=Methylobacterium pseudosasicola TaxID=582667 RepID=UPI0011144016|nr:hypothetical protein [Methylobacterium pseudosasicola]